MKGTLQAPPHNLTSVAGGSNKWGLAFVASGMYLMIPVPMCGRLSGTPKATGWEKTIIYSDRSWQPLFASEDKIQTIFVFDGMAYIQARSYDLGVTGLVEHGIYLVNYLPTLTSV